MKFCETQAFNKEKVLSPHNLNKISLTSCLYLVVAGRLVDLGPGLEVDHLDHELLRLCAGVDQRLGKTWPENDTFYISR